MRLDGMLRAHVQPQHPGVAISFQSKFGPLRYATDAYESRWKGAMPGWKANVRAIALALTALRAVDRYGVSKRGEQYTGWKALPAGSGTIFGTADAAEQWMFQRYRELGLGPAQNLTVVYRKLARRLHPDAGGDPTDWDKLDRARQLLTVAGLL